jgi:hypothetical protein
MQMPFDKLRALSDDEIVEIYDKEAEHVGSYSLNFWRNELFRREQEKATRTMGTLTKWIMIMTCVMTVATIVNVVLFALN